MKRMLETLIGWTLVGVGWNAGNWLWNNVLEEKAVKAKNYIGEKVSKEKGLD
jgi:hypothetical protein